MPAEVVLLRLPLMPSKAGAIVSFSQMISMQLPLVQAACKDVLALGILNFALQLQLSCARNRIASRSSARACKALSIRHCEERSDEAIHVTACGAMDCFAEPVIGRAFARPVGSQ
jgi:hypothetical protein